jgi:hypothetical protein
MKTNRGFSMLWLKLSAPWVLLALLPAYFFDAHPTWVALLVVVGPPAALALLFGAVTWITTGLRD